MNVTIVIPTHNRGAKLIATVERLLANDAVGFDEIEVIVVDDGSTVPAAKLVDGLRASPPLTLRCIRLVPNVGPAGARNAGFRCARGEIVLFVDDDILSPPDLIRRHVQAHGVRPGSVVCGSWQRLEPEPMTPLYRYVDSLGFDAATGSAEKLVPAAIVSSGHISAERSQMFSPEEGVYRDGLSVPAAEEYELSIRLRNRGIPLLSARRIEAWHDQPVTLASMCRQAFKHAMGCAEAAIKCPATRELKEVRDIMTTNGPITTQDRPNVVCKKVAKWLLAPPACRAALLTIVESMERVSPKSALLSFSYRMVMELHVFAGVREGIRVFGSYFDNSRPAAGRAGGACSAAARPDWRQVRSQAA